MKKQLLTLCLVAISGAVNAQGNYYTAQQQYNPNYQADSNYKVYKDSNQTYAKTAPVAKPVIEEYLDRSLEPSARVVIGIGSFPKFMGSKENTLVPAIQPFFSIKPTPRGKVFSSLNEGLGYSYLINRNLELGGALGYRRGRDPDDSPILAGMPSISNTLTYGGFLKYSFDRNYRMGVKVEKGMSGSNEGFVTEFFGGYSTRLGKKTAMDLVLNTQYGDRTFMEQNFGVKSNQTAPNRGEFNTNSGFYRASIRAILNRNIVGPHNISGILVYSRLLGDAAKSTVVETKNSVGAVIGYTYRF